MNTEPTPSAPPTQAPPRRGLLSKGGNFLPVLAGIAVLAIPAWSWLARSRRHAPAKPAERRVAVAKAAREDLDRVLVLPAEFRPFQEIDLHSKVAGFLESIAVDVGDRVAAGQLVATLEVPELQDDLARARAVEQRSDDEVRRAEAAYRDVHSAWSRLAAVVKSQPRLVAQQEVDSALARDQQAESVLAAARQQVAVARADVARLETQVRYTRITAPFAGVITRRAADPGALIPAGTTGSAEGNPIVRLSQNDRLRLAFPVSMSHVTRVDVGTPVEIRVQNLAQPIAARVARITRKIETTTRTMDVEVDVPNPDLSLIPGMYASVAIQLDHRPKALAVPVQAVSREKAPSVLVVGADHVIAERAVQLGLETPTRVEVLSGLREGELVVVGGRGDSRPGESVEPRLAVAAGAQEPLP